MDARLKNRLCDFQKDLRRSLDELQCSLSFWSDRLRKKSGYAARTGFEPKRIRMTQFSGDIGQEHEAQRVEADGTAIISIGDREVEVPPIHYRVVEWTVT